MVKSNTQFTFKLIFTVCAHAVTKHHYFAIMAEHLKYSEYSIRKFQYNIHKNEEREEGGNIRKWSKIKDIRKPVFNYREMTTQIYEICLRENCTGYDIFISSEMHSIIPFAERVYV